MSDTTSISFRKDIVEMTCKLSGMLLKIGCIDQYERLKVLVGDTMTLSNMTELVQHPENLQEILGYFVCIKEYMTGVFKTRTESLFELDSVKGKFSVFLDETEFKLESLRSLAKKLNGILSIV